MVQELRYTVVKSLEQYTEYCNIYERLMNESETQHQQELELLSLLINEYEQRTSPTLDLNPIELLKSLLDDVEGSNANFARSIDISPQLLCDVLNYRRSISKNLVIKLANRFKMQQEAFSRPYELK